jgi:hypothetical protein
LAYRDAGAIATQRGDAFDEWVALHGEEDAALARIDLGDLASEASQAVVDAYGRRRLEMEQTGEVKDWIEKARHLRERLLQRLVERHVRQNRQRAFGGRSESFTNYPHDYWTMFRELEIISAPPALQRRYIQPLIDLGGFDAEEELRYRLQLDVDETEKAKDWISRIIDETGGTVEERRERDGNLVNELKKADVSRFERVRRLDLFPKIAPMLRTTDLDWARSFLIDCKAALGAWIHTFHSHRVLADDYAEAWGAYAALEVRAVVMDHLETYVGTIQGPIEPDELSKELRTMPLTQWVGLHEGAAERLVQLVLGLDRSAGEQEVSGSDEHIAWALHSVVQGVKRFGRPLAEGTWTKVRDYANRLLRKKLRDETAYRSGAFNAAVHLAWLAAPDAAACDAVVQEALARAGEVPHPSYRRGPALEVPLGIWGSLVDAGASPTGQAMAAAADQLWTNVDSTWDETFRVLELNPHHAWPYVMFLVDVIATGAIGAAFTARERLLELLGVTPKSIEFCAKILDSRYWNDRWASVVDLVWTASAGGANLDRVASKLGVVGLLVRWETPSSAGARELPSELGFLVDVTLLALLDESPVVANHAAYAVVGHAARVRSPGELSRIVGALRRMARDPRLAVRGAAAYAGTRLARMNVPDEIRAEAQEIDAALGTETYAVIQRQRVFGELDGKYPTS